MEFYYLCKENKGTDQLLSYSTADLYLSFRIYKKKGFCYDAAHVRVDVRILILSHVYSFIESLAFKLDFLVILFLLLIQMK